MRCLIHQGNSTVAAVRQNLQALRESMMEAASQKVRLVVTPELFLIGYPPRDLLAYPKLYDLEQEALKDLKLLTKTYKVAVLVGHLERVPTIDKNYFYNCASLFDDGNCIGTIRKQRLPSYDVFEEYRFFQPWTEKQGPLLLDQVKLGVFICEDAWDQTPAFGESDIKHHTKESSPWPQLEDADLLINLSASPYSTRKRPLRQALFQEKAASLKKPLIYANSVGAQDDLIFDGGSFACTATGEISAQASLFVEQRLIVDPFLTSVDASIAPNFWGELNQALVLGISDYARKNHMSTALIGLSGGIDSALTACLASQALGSENVSVVSLPTAITSPESKRLARTFASNLGLKFSEQSLEQILEPLALNFGIPKDHLAFENLQARLRGTYLMGQANLKNHLLLATCNKSETAMGYTTLYGDMCGALSPIADLYKTEVYGLSFYLKQHMKLDIPDEILLRAPTAELSPGQLDTDSLPHYAVLDTALSDILENQSLRFHSQASLAFKKEFDLESLFKKVLQVEFKRNQAAPIFKVHARAFGSGWHMPLSKSLKDFDQF